MKLIISCAILSMAILMFAWPSWAGPMSPEERKATLTFLGSLQNADGGFRSSPKSGPSELGATSNAIRAIQYLGGEVNNKGAVEKFIQQFAHESGGYAEKVGGAPDIRSTWSAASALGVIRGSAPENGKKIVEFFSNNAKSLYPDIYFAAGALDYMKMTSPKAAEWVNAFEATRQPDGSYGEGVDDTAHAVVTVSRLGGTLKDRAAAGKVLKAAQRQGDGFAAAKGKAADFAATYTVMRALGILKDKPDLEAIYRFVASRRNADGGYALDAGKPSQITPTYRASAVLYFAGQAEK